MPHKIALIPGDGIGLEVIPEAVRVLQLLAKKFGFQISLHCPFSLHPYRDSFLRQISFCFRD